MRQALAAFAALLACSLAASAPAPLAKAGRGPAMSGRWVLHWNSVAYPYHFRPGGELDGGAWRGWWSYDPASRKLRVVEAMHWNAQVGVYDEWEVALDDSLAGSAAYLYSAGLRVDRGGIDFRLKRPD